MPSFNTKIMVNFGDRKVVHTDAHSGSEEFQSLIRQGYVKTGTIRQAKTGEIKVYWEPDYFEPRAKYIKPLK
jgi:hypothetical protein